MWRRLAGAMGDGAGGWPGAGGLALSLGSAATAAPPVAALKQFKVPTANSKPRARGLYASRHPRPPARRPRPHATQNKRAIDLIRRLIDRPTMFRLSGAFGHLLAAAS